MTEAEWLSATHPGQMLEHIDADAGGRKSYLFAAACLRRIWQLLPGPRSQAVAELHEQLADGNRDFDAMDPAREGAREETRSVSVSGAGVSAGIAASEFCYCILAEYAADAAAWYGTETLDGSRAPEELAQSNILRDIVGNPFRPVAFDPAWRSEAVVGIARGIYEDRAFERMPILADALQDAGCEHPDILTHCREPGEHVRGCWVVDLLLGKE